MFIAAINFLCLCVLKDLNSRLNVSKPKVFLVSTHGTDDESPLGMRCSFLNIHL